MTHEYQKPPVTMKMWMQFNVMPWTITSRPVLLAAGTTRTPVRGPASFLSVPDRHELLRSINQLILNFL